MNIVKNISIENSKKYQVGDLFETSTRMYVLIKEDDGYILRTLSERGTLIGSNGHHHSIEQLISDLNSIITYTHYSKDDFELVLQKKQHLLNPTL